ncbi:hypothetical protein, partial [Pantoea ananatis]|uniref:hypothetical protein n=1 Tax=Pantoea ananas TaxID=553 RepID=UPI0023AEFE1D
TRVSVVSVAAVLTLTLCVFMLLLLSWLLKPCFGWYGAAKGKVPTAKGGQPGAKTKSFCGGMRKVFG